MSNNTIGGRSLTNKGYILAKDSTNADLVYTAFGGTVNGVMVLVLQKKATVGSVVTYTYYLPDSGSDFAAVWNDRATHTYSAIVPVGGLELPESYNNSNDSSPAIAIYTRTFEMLDAGSVLFDDLDLKDYNSFSITIESDLIDYGNPGIIIWHSGNKEQWHPLGHISAQMLQGEHFVEYRYESYYTVTMGLGKGTVFLGTLPTRYFRITSTYEVNAVNSILVTLKVWK